MASQVDAHQDNTVFSAGGSSDSQDAAITTHNIQIAEMDCVVTETIVKYYTSLSPEEPGVVIVLRLALTARGQWRLAC